MNALLTCFSPLHIGPTGLARTARMAFDRSGTKRFPKFHLCITASTRPPATSTARACRRTARRKPRTGHPRSIPPSRRAPPESAPPLEFVCRRKMPSEVPRMARRAGKKHPFTAWLLWALGQDNSRRAAARIRRARAAAGPQVNDSMARLLSQVSWRFASCRVAASTRSRMSASLMPPSRYSQICR